MANFTNNTTQLQNLLAKVNALPNAGGGGGDSTTPETHTIVVVNNTMASFEFIYIVFENGKYVYKWEYITDECTETFENVVHELGGEPTFLVLINGTDIEVTFNSSTGYVMQITPSSVVIRGVDFDDVSTYTLTIN